VVQPYFSIASDKKMKRKLPSSFGIAGKALQQKTKGKRLSLKALLMLPKPQQIFLIFASSFYKCILDRNISLGGSIHAGAAVASALPSTSFRPRT
jgi:hypothetical protein